MVYLRGQLLSALVYFSLLLCPTLVAGHAPTANNARHMLPRLVSLERKEHDILSRQSGPEILKNGAWLASFQPIETSKPTLDGPLRVQKNGTYLAISADFYERKSQGPSPTNGIPILPRDAYRSYFRVVGISSGSSADSFELQLEWWDLQNPKPGKLFDWKNVGLYNVTMTRSTPPSGFPSPNDYFVGDVKSDIATSGHLTMGWVSDYLRKVTLRLDSVANIERPLNNGGEHNWKSVFNAIGYDLKFIDGVSNVEEPSANGYWNGEQMHAAMLKYRGQVDFDKEWYFHLLAVRRIVDVDRGVMYDGELTYNNLPREGAAIAADQICGKKGNDNKTDPINWGKAQGKRFGAVTPAYFRASVHEIGHALSLDHVPDTVLPYDKGYMSVSEDIAQEPSLIGEGPVFPDNIRWGFEAEQELWLRHCPDPLLRPGYQIYAGGTYNSREPTNPKNLVATEQM